VDSEAETVRLGVAIAAHLLPGMLVLLKGDLGTGKTALARVIVRALVGEPGLDVPSPSFALVQPYDGQRGAVLHADLYRLANASETRELGLFDDPGAIVLVEWPERDQALFDAADLVVVLAQGAAETARDVTLASPSGRLDCAGIVPAAQGL
jgi:tRNA threonylcarbamoyl adenosine modification protein YjeE